jgi:hypothetical protein
MRSISPFLSWLTGKVAPSYPTASNELMKAAVLMRTWTVSPPMVTLAVWRGNCRSKLRFYFPITRFKEIFPDPLTPGPLHVARPVI